MRVAVIGAGKIGQAIAEGLIKTGYSVTVTRRRAEKIKHLERLGVTVTKDNKKASSEADLIIISVKPKDVRSILREIRGEVKGKVVISVAAAITIDHMKEVCPESLFVRVMPNITVIVQESLMAYCTDRELTPEVKEMVKKVLEALGRPVEVEESQMDAVTALNGCAPAYLSVILEALTYAGLEVGLSKELALLSAAQAMVGTGKLILEKGKSPHEVRDMVTTPGGVTIEGLLELERAPIRYTIMRAVKKATLKSRRISETIERGTE